MRISAPSLVIRIAEFLRLLTPREPRPYDPYEAKALNRDVEEALRQQ